MTEGIYPLPPRELIFVGSPDYFVEVGEEFLRYLVTLGGLEPDSTVLDIGSGVGRMALPLTRFLSQGSCYEGVDIVEDGVRWCQENISPRFPNFNFQLMDIHNSRYNPRGRLHADEFTFPYMDEQFDVIFLTSVFTHMLPMAVRRYLSEIRRMLRKGGRLLATFFLLNDETEALIRAGKSTLSFKYELDGCRVETVSIPEAVVAYEEKAVDCLLEGAGLDAVGGSPHYGRWSGRERFLSFQDIVVASKR
jgi:SAM-dependent methyltransferase